MAKKKSKTKKSTSNGSTLVPLKRKFRSQPPDIIVAVGQGDNKIEFECYKLFLCCNSEVFDSMFSHSMRENQTSRIELPDKDPDEWKVFYDCIGPGTANLSQVTTENAMTLAPWFHEYQMEALLARCDDIIHDSIISDDNDIVEVDNLKTLLDNLEFCERYSLNRSLRKAIIEISTCVMSAYQYSILKRNLKLFKRVFDVYKCYKEIMDNRLCCQTMTLFAEIEDEEDRSEVDNVWENIYFRRLIETKLEVVSLKKKFEYSTYRYSESIYGHIKGSLVVKGAGLDAVNGIYVRHCTKDNSVAKFRKRGLFRDDSCVFEIYRLNMSWQIYIRPKNRRAAHYYCCNASGAINELPLGYEWVTITGKGIDPPPIVEYNFDPPPIVEYNNQLSSVSNDNL